MKFQIAESFTSALGRLTNQEQKQVKTAAFDLQLNPSHPGLQVHRLTGVRDPDFWSARVSQDIRIIIHKTAASFLLAYVDHHDKAYAWAERRRIETHPRTGSIQIVEIHERVEEIGPLFASRPEPVNVAGGEPSPANDANQAEPIFATLSRDALLDVGTPEDWIDDILTWTEDRYFQMAGHLPAEAAEALLEFAATGQLPTPQPAPAEPLTHPDTLRRVQTITSEEELRLALDFPWDKWSIFLHPSQRGVVERDFAGPARVTGTAGTGKTIVALHRAARAVRSDPHARVLLTTFSRPLANALKSKLEILLGADNADLARVAIASFEDAASELFQLTTGRRPTLASAELQRSILERAIEQTGFSELSLRFVTAEWQQVVDAWDLTDLQSYATVPRIGRKNRMGSRQREALWPVFELARQMLKSKGLMTSSQLYHVIEAEFANREAKPFSHVVVDEAQDLGVAELRMMNAIASGPNALFFAGDLGQRIFQLPFSWLSLGIDVRGRSSSLKINYRTSRQIRESADLLLPSSVQDVDGIEDDRTTAQSIFDGPEPEIVFFDNAADETEAVSAYVGRMIASGVSPHEIGIFVRAPEYLDRARQVAAASGLPFRQLTERAEADPERLVIGTMHLAKGLEFKAVAVMACDDEALPHQERVNSATDEIELKEVFDTERHLLYVACTRAREHLHISGTSPGSEFVMDMRGPC